MGNSPEALRPSFKIIVGAKAIKLGSCDKYEGKVPSSIHLIFDLGFYGIPAKVIMTPT